MGAAGWDNGGMNTPRYDLALLVGNRIFATVVRALLTEARDFIQGLPDGKYGEPGVLDRGLREIAARHEVSPEYLFRASRVALCGRLASPGLYEAIALIGREETLERLGKALRALSDRAGG